MRVLDCQLSLLDKSHGSALFQQGETKVFCAVYGPAEVKVHKEIIDQATVECILKRKTEKSGVQERHFEELISTTCKEILLATMHPRSAIQINLQVMQDAGSLLSCLLNSSCMSLVHAGLPMKAMFVSVCCGITNQDEYICDPNEEKEKDCKCLMTLTYETANFSLLSSYTTGQFSAEEYFKCLRLAKMTAQEVAAFQRVALERFLSKDVIKDDDEDMRNEQMDKNNDNSEVRET